ncbi:MAG: hypothetical protein P8R39_08215 [Alphaproteobacteria bacterium]|nr:hypothetical protein [Alphaproteobacteria bacterium]
MHSRWRAGAVGSRAEVTGETFVTIQAESNAPPQSQNLAREHRWRKTALLTALQCHLGR